MKQCVSTRRDLMRQIVIYCEPEMGGPREGHSTLRAEYPGGHSTQGGGTPPSNTGPEYFAYYVSRMLQNSSFNSSISARLCLPFLQGYVENCSVALILVEWFYCTYILQFSTANTKGGLNENVAYKRGGALPKK